MIYSKVFSSSLRARSPKMQLRKLEVEVGDSKMERSVYIHIQQLIRYCSTIFFEISDLMMMFNYYIVTRVLYFEFIANCISTVFKNLLKI